MVMMELTAVGVEAYCVAKVCTNVSSGGSTCSHCCWWISEVGGKWKDCGTRL